ncbi:hypothetical protein OKW29_006457 [Paraburkholderia sp. CI3]
MGTDNRELTLCHPASRIFPATFRLYTSFAEYITGRQLRLQLACMRSSGLYLIAARPQTYKHIHDYINLLVFV